MADQKRGPIVAKRPRTEVVSKPDFLEAFTGFMKSEGVCFKKGNSYTQSKNDFWKLFCNFKKFEAAAAASAGTRISLSGVGVYEFREAGRTPESRCLRMKFKPSSAIDNFFRDNQSLVKSGARSPMEVFQANIKVVMDGLSPVKDGEEVIEVAEAGAEAGDASAM